MAPTAFLPRYEVIFHSDEKCSWRLRANLDLIIFFRGNGIKRETAAKIP